MRKMGGLGHSVWGLALLCSVGCSPGTPQVGSQTNWLKVCETSEDCGDLQCVCGTCTVACETDSECGDSGYGECIGTSDKGAIAACDGEKPDSTMCLPRCDSEACPSGSTCVADVCVAAMEPTVQVDLDTGTKFQTLIGFGASLSYDEGLLESHPMATEMLDAMFKDSGFKVIRLRNNFDGTNAADMQRTAAILDEATTRLGSTPVVMLSSASPPADLKGNGDTYCSNSDVTCTLSKDMDGGFDYAGYGTYWQESLDAYKTAGVVPDYISIQSNVDYIPPSDVGVEACRFLPEEGTASVTLPDGSTVDASFAGYKEALSAVQTAIASVGDYKIMAAETGSAVMTKPYIDAVDGLAFDAIATHLYATDPLDVNVSTLEDLGALGKSLDKPILQTEMAEDGLSTAVLAHYALTSLGASAYLQQRFLGQSTDPDDPALIHYDDTSVVFLPPYYALTHFSRSTEPGWVRVDGQSDDSELLVSAWLSPDNTKLTVVLVNPSEQSKNVRVGSTDASDLLSTAEVTRTVFDADERAASLGALAEERVVRVPAHSAVTITTAP